MQISGTAPLKVAASGEAEHHESMIGIPYMDRIGKSNKTLPSDLSSKAAFARMSTGISSNIAVFDVTSL